MSDAQQRVLQFFEGHLNKAKKPLLLRLLGLPANNRTPVATLRQRVKELATATTDDSTERSPRKRQKHQDNELLEAIVNNSSQQANSTSSSGENEDSGGQNTDVDSKDDPVEPQTEESTNTAPIFQNEKEFTEHIRENCR